MNGPLYRPDLTAIRPCRACGDELGLLEPEEKLCADCRADANELGLPTDLCEHSAVVPWCNGRVAAVVTPPLSASPWRACAEHAAKAEATGAPVEWLSVNARPASREKEGS